ncbi:MAG: DUF3775 domain-containing protein [Azospirillaceae bacterium]
MLTVSLEEVCTIIQLARIFDGQEGVVEPDPGSNPSDDRDVEILEAYPDDPTFEALAGAIDVLNEDEQYDLVALAWIGRGDYSGEEWEDARAQAASTRDRQMPGYLLGIPQLGDFLEEGLDAIGLSCADLE